MVAQPQEPARFPEQVERRILRVLAGPQAGAEVALRDGIYLVGTDDGCDIVLFDDSVAAAHLAISVSQDATDVEARDGAVALPTGTLQPGERAGFDEAVALTLGATSIAIGDRDTDWASLAVPAAPELVEAAPDDDDDTETAEEEADETAAETPAEVAEEPAHEAPEPAEQPVRRHRWLLLPAGLLLLLALPTAGWFYVEDRASARETSAASKPDPATLVARVRGIVGGLELTEVTVAAGEATDIALSGYVPDAAKHAALRQALGAAGIEFTDKLRAAGDLVTQARLTLANYGWSVPDFGDHLHVSYGGFGTVFVDGYLGPQVDRTALQRQILGDVPGIAALRFRQADVGYWVERLEARLAQAGLGRWLTVSAEHGDVRVEGELTEKEAHSWREAGEAFVKESEGWPKLDIAVRLVRRGQAPVATTPAPAPVETSAPVAPPPTAAPVEAPDITVVGVITSGNGFKRVLLSDGATLGEGDTVEDKFTVAEIHADRVVLSTQGRTFTYHVKEAK